MTPYSVREWNLRSAADQLCLLASCGTGMDIGNVLRGVAGKKRVPVTMVREFRYGGAFAAMSKDIGSLHIEAFEHVTQRRARPATILRLAECLRYVVARMKLAGCEFRPEVEDIVHGTCVEAQHVYERSIGS